VRLALNAYLLWRGLYPDQAISKETKQNATFFLFTGDKREQLSGDDVNLLRPQGQRTRSLRYSSVKPTYLNGSCSFESCSICPHLVEQQTRWVPSSSVPFRHKDKNGAELLRWVAWCFGSGSRSLRRAATEPRFGLIAALNAVVEARQSSAAISGTASTLRRVGLKATGPYHQAAGFRAAYDIRIDAFRIVWRFPEI
jgi:hypothetical protein